MNCSTSTHNFSTNLGISIITFALAIGLIAASSHARSSKS